MVTLYELGGIKYQIITMQILDRIEEKSPPADNQTTSTTLRSQNHCHQMETRTRVMSESVPNIRFRYSTLLLVVFTIAASSSFKSQYGKDDSRNIILPLLIQPASGHVVLTRDDRGSSLVLTGEDGKGGKGKGGGDQLVIAGSNMGGDNQNTNMVLEDASNREGDVVINGGSMIIPGEDGHIVLADGRSKEGGGGGGRPPPFNPMIFWLPYMNSRSSLYRVMPLFGSAFGR